MQKKTITLNILEEVMKTYVCIAHSGNTGKEIVLFVRAFSASSARADALEQARKHFGSGPVSIVNCKEA